jgi:GT2 family glycosyltransferase
MSGNSVFAIIVSFNGGEKTRRVVEALCDQVGHVHIVDNGSKRESASVLEDLSLKKNVSVTWLGRNEGIGAALNVGLSKAQGLGYRWLLTMDQDSTPSDSMMAAYFAAILNNPSAVCLTPRRNGEKYNNSWPEVELVEYAITSGNLFEASWEGSILRLIAYALIGWSVSMLFTLNNKADSNMRDMR